MLLKKAVIKKIKNKWVIFSRKGKRLGEFSSKTQAEKRLRQIEFFKHKKASSTIDLSNIEEVSYSCVSREIFKTKNKELIEFFLSTFKNNFDSSLLHNGNFEHLALFNTLQDLKEKYDIKIPSIKQASLRIEDDQLSMPRFAKVTDDLYRGGAPNKHDLTILVDKYGIKKIVSLDERVAQNIHNDCVNLGIHHIILPIDGSRNSLMNIFNYNLDELLLDNGPTFIHCYHGKDRTGLIIALLECKYLGASKEDALKEARSFGFCKGLSEHVTELYTNLVLECKPEESKHETILEKSKYNDFASTDIRNTYGETGGTSLAPYTSRTFSEAEHKYEQPNSISLTNNKESNKGGDKIPLVGISDNPEGLKGCSGITAVFNQSMTY